MSLMNGVEVKHGPFTKGLVEELRKLNDHRIDGYLAVISSLDGRMGSASNRKDKA